MLKRFVVLGLIFFWATDIFAQTEQINRFCRSGNIEKHLPVGYTYHQVLKQIGSPKHKIEQETKRREIWVYSSGTVEFQAGKLRLVRCADLQKIDPKQINTVPSAASAEVRKDDSVNTSSAEVNLKNVSDAISALSAGTPDTEVPGTSAGAPANSAGISFPTGTKLPDRGAIAEPFDMVE